MKFTPALGSALLFAASVIGVILCGVVFPRALSATADAVISPWMLNGLLSGIGAVVSAPFGWRGFINRRASRKQPLGMRLRISAPGRRYFVERGVPEGHTRWVLQVALAASPGDALYSSQLPLGKRSMYSAKRAPEIAWRVPHLGHVSAAPPPSNASRLGGAVALKMCRHVLHWTRTNSISGKAC